MMVKIKGKTFPLEECFWVRFNPEGCAVGSVLRGFANTEEEAHKEFTTRKADRLKEIKAGYVFELVPRNEWKERIEPCFMKTCEHSSTHQLKIPEETTE